MTMNEIKEKYPNCPNCGRHCPIDAVSCPRGQAFVEKLLSGELEASPAESREHGEWHEHGDWHGRGEDRERSERHGRGEGSEHGERHGHGEGREHGSRHEFTDDGSLASLLHQCMHTLRHGDGRGMGQGRILRILSQVEEMNQRELQEQLGVQPGSLSEILGKLEGKGLIQRSRDEQDKRKATVRLSDERRKALSDAAEKPERKDPFAVLTDDEQATLRALLTKVLEAAK